MCINSGWLKSKSKQNFWITALAADSHHIQLKLLSFLFSNNGMTFLIVFILTEHPQMTVLTLHSEKEITRDSAVNNF